MERNEIRLKGNITNDPELKEDKKGRVYLKVNIAASELEAKDQKGQWREKDAANDKWHSALYFGAQAKSMAEKGLQKGDFIRLEGDREVSKQTHKGKEYVNSLVHDAAIHKIERLQTRPMEMEARLLEKPVLKQLADGKEYAVAQVRVKDLEVAGQKADIKENREPARSVFFYGEAARTVSAMKERDMVKITGDARDKELGDGKTVEAYRGRTVAPALELGKSEPQGKEPKAKSQEAGLSL
jgi:single-stranded DNA-binding protein